MKRRKDRAGTTSARVWPARVLLACWVVALVALLVADPSWVPAGLLAATAAAVAGSVLLGAFSGKRMEAQLFSPGRAHKGAPVSCVLKVCNRSALPVWRAQVPVQVRNPVTGESAVVALAASAGPHGELTVPFEVESPYCGTLSLECESSSALDILGIVRRRRGLAAATRVAVPPAALPLGTRRTGARAHDIESFTYAPDRPGDDPGETFAVREYAPGDSVRRIHWKLSGKLGTTMVRESGFPIYSSLLLLVETGWGGEGPDPAAADAQMEAVASICASLLEAGAAFELAFLDRASGTVVIRRVANEAAMWDAIGLLMAAPREAAAESSIRAFLESAGGTVWAHAVYMTAGEMGADASALVVGGGKLTVLRCMPNGAAGGAVRRDGSDEVRFAPETWQDDLAEVVL